MKYALIALTIVLTGCSTWESIGKDRAAEGSEKVLETASYARCAVPFLTYVKKYGDGEALNEQAKWCQKEAISQ